MPEEVVIQAEQTYSPEEQAFLESVDTAPEETEPVEPLEIQPEPKEEVKKPDVKAETAEESPKQIPLAELMQERRKRQEAEHRYAQAVSRLETIIQQSAKAVEETEEIPDRNEDPVGYLAWQQGKTLDEIRSLKAEKAQSDKQTEEQRVQQQFLSEYQRNIDNFAQQTPDYNDAAQFLLRARDDELQTLGIDDPDQRVQILHQDALTIGAYSMQQGKNPGEIFYNLAKKRGYAKAAAAATTTVSPLDTVRKGQAAATTLSGTGGGGGTELTAEALLAMSDNDFKKFTQGKKWAKLHGRT
jgi:hypothetical protein